MDVDAVSSFSEEGLKNFRRTVSSRCAGHLNAEDREDVASAILLEAVRGSGGSGVPVLPLAFLGSRRARHYERAAVRVTASRGELGDGEDLGAAAGLADPADPLTTVEFDDLVSRLPHAQRVAFRLCVVKGATLAEASAATGVPQSTVHARVQAAKAALARAWREAERV